MILNNNKKIFQKGRVNMTAGRLAVWRVLVACLLQVSAAYADALPWTSSNKYRVLLKVDTRGIDRSNSPASMEIDFPKALESMGDKETFDQSTIEVVAYDSTGKPRIYDASRGKDDRYLLPWRLDTRFGTGKATMNFIIPDHTCIEYAIYFDTQESGLGKPKRYPGLVGDGDLFREGFKRREINACKFDNFCDFDGDGDLDLFKAGTEPFIYSYENVGGNRMEYRGKLSSDGAVLALPHYDNGRGWMSITFDNWDGDGDQDLFPNMSDGPDTGHVLVYENVTPTEGGRLKFVRRGRLLTQDGTSVGGRFVAIAFADWDGDGKKDVVAAGYKTPMFFRNVGSKQDIWDIQLASAEPILADGKDLPFVPSGVDVADMDQDGDLDLLAAHGRGPIHLFINKGTRTSPVLGEGVMVAYKVPYKIGDAHTGVKAADFNGDGLMDFVGGRFWERTPLSEADQPRYYGGLFKNVGPAGAPRFERADSFNGSPYTERFQICDAVRQNSVCAVDWNDDGQLDLIAGDTDGFVWYFRNEASNPYPLFATGIKLRVKGEILSHYKKGGHARPDIVDWNNDGKRDLVIADGGGWVTVYLNSGSNARPVLEEGLTIEAEGEPIKSRSGRSSVTVADWDNDGKKDLVYADQDRSKGYRYFKNIGTDAEPVFAKERIILFKGKHASYVRTNLGCCVDWDGDGKTDLIACGFENDIRFYKNIGSGAAGAEPQFANTKGVIIVKPFCVQMVSGADAVDFNGDGDLDILTGQGHAASGLRYYERDYIEDCLNNTHPVVKMVKVESKR